MASAFPLTTLNMQKNIPVLMVVPYRGSQGDGIWFMGPMSFTTEPFLKDLHVAYTVISKVGEIAPAIEQAHLSAEAWLPLQPTVLTWCRSQKDAELARAFLPQLSNLLPTLNRLRKSLS